MNESTESLVERISRDFQKFEFVPQDLGQEDVVGHVLWLEDNNPLLRIPKSLAQEEHV